MFPEEVMRINKKEKKRNHYNQSEDKKQGKVKPETSPSATSKTKTEEKMNIDTGLS